MASDTWRTTRKNNKIHLTQDFLCISFFTFCFFFCFHLLLWLLLLGLAPCLRLKNIKSSKKKQKIHRKVKNWKARRSAEINNVRGGPFQGKSVSHIFLLDLFVMFSKNHVPGKHTQTKHYEINIIYFC